MLRGWVSFSSITTLLFSVYLYHASSTFYTILFPSIVTHDPKSQKLFRRVKPEWLKGSAFNVSLYLGESPNYVQETKKKIINFEDLTFDEETLEKRELVIDEKSLGVELWRKLGENRTLYAHFAFRMKNHQVLWATAKLVKFLHIDPKPIKRYLVRDWPLLGGYVPVDEPEVIHDPASGSTTIVGYWIPMANAAFVTDWTEWPIGGSTGTVLGNLKFTKSNSYYPVVYTSLLGLTNEKLVQINHTRNNAPMVLDVSIGAMSLARWQYNVHMEETLRMQKSIGAGEKDIDDLRHMLTETEPMLLAITMLVTLFHVLFDVLAFKSDISFWSNTKSTNGLSVKTLTTDLVSQIIIAIYLHEQNASILVLAPAGFSVMVQVWKVRRAYSVGGGGKTEEFDGHATNFMLAVLLPAVLAYSLYSLVFEKHPGFYSWGIGSLASSVYAFGFIMMCPQIFINYKLKSVAHLPWRFFLYKSMNTFIDDLFAFIIRMPTLHRAACFRGKFVCISFWSLL